MVEGSGRRGWVGGNGRAAGSGSVGLIEACVGVYMVAACLDSFNYTISTLIMWPWVRVVDWLTKSMVGGLTLTLHTAEEYARPKSADRRFDRRKTFLPARLGQNRGKPSVHSRAASSSRHPSEKVARNQVSPLSLSGMETV